MKNFFKQLGKAICYFLLFFGMQLIVSLVVMFVIAIQVGFEAGMNGGGALTQAEMVAMSAEISDRVVQSTNLIGIISGGLTLLFLWLFFLIREKQVLAEASVTKFAGKYVPFIILLGVAFSGAISFGMGLLPESILEAYAQQSNVLVEGALITIVISTMIVAPIVEEVIFRGLIYGRLCKAMPKVWAMVLSSLIFGVAHGQIVWMIYAFVLGMVLCVVMEKTKSVMASILLHMSFNVAGIVLPTVFADVNSIAANATVLAVGTVLSVIMLTIILRMKESESREGAE